MVAYAACCICWLLYHVYVSMLPYFRTVCCYAARGCDGT